MIREHRLKTLPEFFEPLDLGSKKFEIRRNDRDFQLGDVLVLQEWHAERGYTGREIRKRVSYILPGGAYGLERGYVCMGLYYA